jgi:alpha-L-fucosidase
MGWPDDGKIVVKSLAKTENADVNEIKRVELLGKSGKLKFTQTAEGLMVELPAQKISDLTCSLKITGSHLQPVVPPATANVVAPDAHGRLTLSATDAELHGSQLKLEEQGGLEDIGFWDNGAEWVSWTAQITKPGAYHVSATTATVYSDAAFVLEIGGQKVNASIPRTEGWDKFMPTELGSIEIRQTGPLAVSVRSKDGAAWKAINLNSIKLTPIEGK